MDQVMSFVEPGRQFAKDSIRLVKRCTKPDRKGFNFIYFNSFFNIKLINN
jgi:protein transport protein SEC61 subunit gamma-like protein